jgi:hypothetical protein
VVGHHDPVESLLPPDPEELILIGSPSYDMGGCALYSDGSLWCWGGLLASGLGLATSSPARLELHFGPVAAIAGANTACALSVDRTRVACWGANWWGELGDGSVGRPSAVPVPVVGFE